jgi:CRP-like cAMP-binding protein
LLLSWRNQYNRSIANTVWSFAAATIEAFGALKLQGCGGERAERLSAGLPRHGNSLSAPVDDEQWNLVNPMSLGRHSCWRTAMPGPNARQTSPESAGRQLPHLPSNEDLRAFTDKLGPVVSLAHWQRGDCCDAIVANGGIGWVLSGIVHKCVIHESGQRRIVDLMMPGDFLGMRTDDARLFSFEASTDETLTARITRRDFNTLAELRPSLYQFFHESACQTIARLEPLLVQGRTTSMQKIASYLLLMSRRLSAQRDDAPVLLPVSRYDIADHVGIAVETVSRAITELRRQGVIELETPRCLAMKDTQKLADGVPDRR